MPAANAADNAQWSAVSSYKVAATPDLRGFGSVRQENTVYAKGQAKIWITRFWCANQSKANVLAGKFLGDLELTDGIVKQALPGGQPVFALPSGAAVTVCVEGAEARILAAASIPALRAFASAMPSLSGGAVATASYPVYLDKFDKYGWGMYGLGGFSNTHDWMAGASKAMGIPVTDIDPMDDLKYMAAHRLRFEPWLDPVEFNDGDGLQMGTDADWQVQWAKKLGLPVSFRVYGMAGGANWIARRFPDFMEQPADFLMSGWHGADLFYKTQKHVSWYSTDLHRYMAAQTMKMMRRYNDEPNNLGWMHPHGELVHDQWYNEHADYSPQAAQAWRQYLQKRGLDLATVSRMYGRGDQPFPAWDTVPIPEAATFFGLGGQVQSLAGEWYYRAEYDADPRPDAAWWAKPATDRYQGVKEQWWQGAVDGKAWTSVQAPGSDALGALLIGKKKPAESTSWFRRSFSLTQSQLTKPKIYLYWSPVSFGGIHSGDHKRYHEVYINGEKAGEVGQTGALDVTSKLHAGENQIALHLMGPIWNGRIFLSAEAPAVYPYLGKDRNQLYIHWRQWDVEAKHTAWAEIMDGMRQVDPDRPIKFMAPQSFGADRWIDLAVRYGGYPHFTGEGMWYYPWYKRYAFPYGIPGSSELAGPMSNVDEQYDAFRRVFLAGLNCHDPVFMAQSYIRRPDLKKWWEVHDPVLKRLGKYDLDGPQVVLFRSTEFQTILAAVNTPYPELGQAREIQSSWNWDIGRGALQTIGQSSIYLDDGGVKDGKMYGYPVMIDGGNEVMSEATIAQIAEWVKAGGTFVTLPFTGRNTYLAGDAWPITSLTGCQIGTMRDGAHGTVTFAKDQSVFRALAGKTFPDTGKSMDWVGNNLNKLSVELKPGADCSVLATFENGAPAIVKRSLGKGAVIALGTTFWRNSQDRKGVWWPEAIETSFLSDLLAGTGYPAAPCETDDRLVWPQPYRSNNGLESVTVLTSWHEDKAAKVNVTLRLPAKPTRLVSYSTDGEKSLPFTWSDGVATTSLTVGAREVVVLNADTYSPDAAVSHWWDYQQKMWHALAKPTIDFTPYTKGRFADPTLDLRDNARFTNAKPGESWTAPAFDDAKWTPSSLGIFNLNGAKEKQPLWVRRTFEVPAEWQQQGGDIYLVSGAWSGPQYRDKARLYLNGKMMHDFSDGSNFNYQDYLVTRQLQPGKNVVAFEFAGSEKNIGIVGNVFLYHRVPGERSLNLAGRWDGVDAGGKDVSYTIPGTGSVFAPSRTVAIPLEWQGKYRVRLWLEGSKYSVLGAMVNGTMVRRHHHPLSTRCDIDITDQIKFGQDNTLTLIPQDSAGFIRHDGPAPAFEIREARLELFPVEGGTTN
jgi:hypothetical protein